ncbi:MAG: DUF2277 domain-containing protein [Acidimicrobiia bacterium]
MCRSIVQLRKPEGVTEDELTAAARQFVRKISGFRTPSKDNEEVFERAIGEIAGSSRHLLEHLIVRAPVRVEGGGQAEIESSEEASRLGEG